MGTVPLPAVTAALMEVVKVTSGGVDVVIKRWMEDGRLGFLMLLRWFKCKRFLHEVNL